MGASNPQFEDFNGDAHDDLIIGDNAGVFHFFTRDSGGNLSFKETLKANGAEIDIFKNSTPEIVDWNQDGLLDMITGGYNMNPEPFRIFLNSGTETEYKFTDYSELEAGGETVYENRSHPWVADMNLNGRKDLIIGEKYGHVYFYENIGTNADPQLLSGVNIKVNGADIQTHLENDAKPCVTDWNEDGIPDLVIGSMDSNFVGHVFLALGGTP